MKSHSKIIIDIMIAIAISLVVNFSHLLLIFIDREPQRTTNTEQVAQVASKEIAEEATDQVYNDITESEKAKSERIKRYKAGDDYTTQLLYYFVLSLTVILVSTSNLDHKRRNATLRRLLIAIALAIALYFVAPLTSHRHRGEFIFHHIINHRPILDFMVVLKFSFAVIVALLYSQIYTLMMQRQNIILENEQLRSESINAQYNMLMSQINPHVLFNSLNSLSMLIREHDEQRSLTYIDQLSYTFRYILQNRESTLTTLAEELRFVDAYIYLFKIRYADKLFFDIEIDPQYNDYQIPTLSLQPLLDNAVKHNTILSSRPFHVSIEVKQGVLIVANNKHPKLDAEPSTGVGLENLRRRWELIASHPIEVINSEKEFVVRLPLIKPQSSL